MQLQSSNEGSPCQGEAPVYLVWLNGLEAPTEELKPPSLFVHLHPFSIVLDLRIHPIGALLHCHGNRATRLSLETWQTVVLNDKLSRLKLERG